MDACDHIQRLDLSWFESRRTGALMSVLNDDINQMERHADVIYVLEDGRIVEQGTNETLLEQRGQCAALWRLQTGERDPEPLPSVGQRQGL